MPVWFGFALDCLEANNTKRALPPPQEQYGGEVDIWSAACILGEVCPFSCPFPCPPISHGWFLASSCPPRPAAPSLQANVSWRYRNDPACAHLQHMWHANAYSLARSSAGGPCSLLTKVSVSTEMASVELTHPAQTATWPLVFSLDAVLQGQGDVAPGVSARPAQALCQHHVSSYLALPPAVV